MTHNRVPSSKNLRGSWQATTSTNNFQDTVIKNFYHQWKALKEGKKEGVTVEPNAIKKITIIGWYKAFDDFLIRVIGTRTVLLSCAIRDDDEVSGVLPPLSPNSFGPEEFGSAEHNLVARMSCDHPSFKDNNDKLHHYLEEATRSAQHVDSNKS